MASLSVAKRLLNFRSARLLAFMGAMIALFFTPVPPASHTARAAQDTGDPPRYDGADIVFLIDQSGSMCGRSCNNPSGIENDPDKRRFEVARFALNVLGQMRYAYAPFSDRPIDIHASVIYFGGLEDKATQIERPVENLVISPDSPEQWQTVWQGTEPLMSPEVFGNRSLGFTDFRAAYAEAQNQFRAMGTTGNRMRVIIVVTDGQPSAPIGPDQFENAIVHMEALIGDVQQSFSGSNDRFYIVALNDANPYWTGGPGITAMEPYWQRIVENRGFARLVPRNEDVTAQVQEAVNEIADGLFCVPGTASNRNCPRPVTDSVVVIPYLQQVTFILHKIRPDDGVEFENDGVIINLDGVNVTRFDRDKLVETIVIRNPPPGIWQVRRLEDRKVTIFAWDILEPRFSLELLSPPDNLGCNRPTSLRVRAFAPDGTIVSELPGYPISVDLQLMWPTGAQPVTLGQPVAPGVYETRDFLQGKGTGIQAHLKAVTIDPTGQPLPLFDDIISTFDTPDCAWDLSAPSQADQHNTIDVSLALVEGNRPLPLVASGEYEIAGTLRFTPTLGTNVISFRRSQDNLITRATVRLTQCGLLTWVPEISIRDVVTGREEVQKLAEQTLDVACKVLVQMNVNPAGARSEAACEITGRMRALQWDITLKDENGNDLAAQTVLANPGVVPFVATSNVGGGAQASWHPGQLPPNSSGYQYELTGVTSGNYTVTLDFNGALRDGYIKDNTAHFETTLQLTPPENLDLWRLGASVAGALAMALLTLLFFLVRIYPTLGNVFVGEIALTSSQRVRRGAVNSAVTIDLGPVKKETISADAYYQLNDYASGLRVHQDPNQWDSVTVTPLFDEEKSESVKPIKLQLNVINDLPNRNPELESGMLEYKADIQEAQEKRQLKMRLDTSKKNRMLWAGIALATVAGLAIWQLLPLGC